MSIFGQDSKPHIATEHLQKKITQLLFSNIHKSYSIDMHLQGAMNFQGQQIWRTSEIHHNNALCFLDFAVSGHHNSERLERAEDGIQL